MEFLAPFARGVALDVGCGERPYDDLFVPRVERYVGIEYPPSADNLVSVWDILHQLKGVIDVFADGRRLPIKDRCIDTVLALEVLEHVPDPEACLAEVDRVLKPDGRLLLTVPFVAPLHQLPFDYQRFTPHGLEAVLGRHGFAIRHLQPRGNFSSVVGSTSAHWLLRTFGGAGMHQDGSVKLSRWRAPLLSPLVALLQLGAVACERWSDDQTSTLGYAVVAERR
jgi:SAM-dependent methyltransferase